MGRRKKISVRKNEQGVIITLVAVFLLGVVGAMAALSIDVVTLYTARSEAQLAADAAALAAARVLANSGATSDTSGGSMLDAWNIAKPLAIQVAMQNKVGGAPLTTVTPTRGGSNGNPTVTVTVQTTLPTFFARIWGTKTVIVKATAIAEAYNPTPGTGGVPPNPPLPVAPMCVKPWLLPNMSPTVAGRRRSDFRSDCGHHHRYHAIGMGDAKRGGPGATRLRNDCEAPGGDPRTALRHRLR